MMDHREIDLVIRHNRHNAGKERCRRAIERAKECQARARRWVVALSLLTVIVGSVGMLVCVMHNTPLWWVFYAVLSVINIPGIVRWHASLAHWREAETWWRNQLALKEGKRHTPVTVPSDEPPRAA